MAIPAPTNFNKSTSRLRSQTCLRRSQQPSSFQVGSHPQQTQLSFTKLRLRGSVKYLNPTITLLLLLRSSSPSDVPHWSLNCTCSYIVNVLNHIPVSPTLSTHFGLLATFRSMGQSMGKKQNSRQRCVSNIAGDVAGNKSLATGVHFRFGPCTSVSC